MTALIVGITGLISALLGGGGVVSFLKWRGEHKISLMDIYENDAKQAREDIRELEKEFRLMNRKIGAMEVRQEVHLCLLSRTLAFLKDLDEEQYNGHLAELIAHTQAAVAELSVEVQCDE